MVVDTSRYGIPCLDNDDPAAVALHMQCLGEQIEAELVSRQDQVSSMLERPAVTWLVTETLGGGIGGSINNFADSIVFSYRWPTPGVLIPLGLANTRGWWNIGATVHAEAAGGVTADEYRAIWLGVQNPNAPASSADLDDYAAVFEDVAWESSTGNGEDLFVGGNVFNPGNTLVPEDQIGMTIRFGQFIPDASPPSDITFTCRIWALFLGDLPEIEVTG